MALYLASYFDQNKSSQAYFRANKKSKFFFSFVQGPFGKVLYNEEYLNTLKSSFNVFLKKCIKATASEGESKKLFKLIQHKKLFSCVWLLSSAEDLLKSESK